MVFSTSSSDFSPQAALGLRTRCRSFCFLERNGEPWTAFLVTYPENDQHWKGHFMFRSALVAPDSGEIRTADLFVEATEAAIDARARGLGRPMLEALLNSALHTHSRSSVSAKYVHWFRDLLAKHATQLSSERTGDPARSMQRLKVLYDSYRTDQISHFIALLDPDAFRHLCDKLLAGREIDFRARDRLQLSMIVVQELERLLPLPPFEVWVEDYLAHRTEHERYTHQLHNGELP